MREKLIPKMMLTKYAPTMATNAATTATASVSSSDA
jgi:hypothetical protein